MPSLPQEVIEDILYLLPAKTIGRCRCVSKAWLALLTQPHFIKTHLKHTLKQPTQSSTRLLVSSCRALFSIFLSNAHHLPDEMPLSETKLNIPIKPADKWCFAIAACDGLVLVLDDEDNQWLINPTTLAVRAVSPLPFATNLRAIFPMSRLGYDKRCDDYKVVRLSFYQRHSTHSLKLFASIFSVKTGAWRTLENSPYDRYVKPYTTGVFLDGSIHWLANKMTENYTCTIVAFSLCDEKFYELPSPNSFVEDGYLCVWLRVLGGCLCMGSSKGYKETDVWVMKEYGVLESWTKFITIVAPEEAEVRPLCLLAEERVLLVKDVGLSCEKLVSYDVKEGTMKEIEVNGITGYYLSTGNGMIYVESLISPDSCHEAKNE